MMRRKNYENMRLRKEVRDVKRELRSVRDHLERCDRMDALIKEMKRSAREMLLMSREL